ncbi:hypothetical protein FK531_15230 [Rhodococcus spelaei]|uniref:Uncharacterized protein n=1 Tax=Rhodococcus spelaei TaxID=2546320 RepID=A0A541B811_9NOCA|nr:hypothetical protein [Rhodococcus spelaei]TQF68428.1 hypothetical protein FK531_15230 [Rhodococcus spelaei]
MDDGDFVLEDLTVGAHAHGFGRNAQGQAFAFRVRGSTLHVEVYRDDLDADVPEKSDVVAVAERTVNDIDLTDARSIAALVRDAVGQARPVESEEGPVRALLSRIGTVIDGF